MSRTRCRIWRRLRRHTKARLAKVWAEYEGVRVRMIRYRPSRDWSVFPAACVDDFPRGRRTHGWKNSRCRRQWERRVRMLEKRDRVLRRKRC